MATYEDNYGWGYRAVMEAVASMWVGVPNNLGRDAAKQILTPLFPVSQVQGLVTMVHGQIAQQILRGVRKEEDAYAERLVASGYSDDAGREMALAENARLARNAGVGKCAEMAAISFIYLRDNGKFPIDYVYWGNSFGSMGGHTFAILGRDTNSDIANPQTWGSACVVVDPHMEQRAFPPGMAKHYFGQQNYKCYLRLEAPST